MINFCLLWVVAVVLIVCTVPTMKEMFKAGQ